MAHSNSLLTDIRRLLDSSQRVHVTSVSDDTAVSIDSASDTTITLEENPNNASNNILSEAIPDNYVRLTTIEFTFTNIANGATEMSWYLSRDSAGANAVTPRITTAWYVYSGTSATATALIDAQYAKVHNVGSSGVLYLQAQLDAGDVDVLPRLFWTSATFPPTLPF